MRRKGLHHSVYLSRLFNTSYQPIHRLARRALLVAVLAWLLVAPGVLRLPAAHGAAAARAHGLVLRVIPLHGLPLRMTDDAATGRLFVLTEDVNAPYAASSIALLDARTGTILTTITLTTHGPDGVMATLPISGDIAIDAHNGRAFVLSQGPFYRKGDTTGLGIVFMLDAKTGRELQATPLDLGPASVVMPSNLLVDEQVNRVFVGYGGVAKISVLDATTGRILHTARYPASDEGAGPIGVDTRDHRLVIGTNRGIAIANETTAESPRYVPQTQYVGNAYVDGRRGLLLAISGDVASQAGFAIADLASGKVLHAIIVGSGSQVLTMDQASGRAVVFAPEYHGVLGAGSSYSIIDEVSGHEVGGTLSLMGTNPIAALADAAINPTTRHVVVTTSDNPLSGPVHLDVIDLYSGKILRVIRMPSTPGVPILAVDAPTRHVFLANRMNNTITIYDGAKL
jgi:DNA-binding beta-propeller fold protein YncE